MAYAALVIILLLQTSLTVASSSAAAGKVQATASSSAKVTIKTPFNNNTVKLFPIAEGTISHLITKLKLADLNYNNNNNVNRCTNGSAKLSTANKSAIEQEEANYTFSAYKPVKVSIVLGIWKPQQRRKNTKIQLRPRPLLLLYKKKFFGTLLTSRRNKFFKKQAGKAFNIQNALSNASQQLIYKILTRFQEKYDQNSVSVAMANTAKVASDSNLPPPAAASVDILHSKFTTLELNFLFRKAKKVDRALFFPDLLTARLLNKSQRQYDNQMLPSIKNPVENGIIHNPVLWQESKNALTNQTKPSTKLTQQQKKQAPLIIFPEEEEMVHKKKVNPIRSYQRPSVDDKIKLWTKEANEPLKILKKSKKGSKFGKLLKKKKKKKLKKKKKAKKKLKKSKKNKHKKESHEKVYKHNGYQNYNHNVINTVPIPFLSAAPSNNGWASNQKPDWSVASLSNNEYHSQSDENHNNAVFEAGIGWPKNPPQAPIAQEVAGWIGAGGAGEGLEYTNNGGYYELEFIPAEIIQKVVTWLGIFAIVSSPLFIMFGICWLLLSSFSKATAAGTGPAYIFTGRSGSSSFGTINTFNYNKNFTTDDDDDWEEKDLIARFNLS